MTAIYQVEFASEFFLRGACYGVNMNEKLSQKKQRFVEEYLIDMNATQAAIRAGYSEKTAKSQGQRLLTKADVQESLAQARAEQSARVSVTADYVVNNLKEIVERCMQRAPVLNMKGFQVLDDDGRGVWRFDAKGANRALELLGKHLGMFTDKIEADVKQDVKVVLFGGD